MPHNPSLQTSAFFAETGLLWELSVETGIIPRPLRHCLGQMTQPGGSLPRTSRLRIKPRRALETSRWGRAVDIDEYPQAIFPDRVTSKHRLAGSRIATIIQFVLPAMPGAGHNSAGDLALGDGTARVGTDPIDGEPVVCGMKECDNPVPHDALQAGADRDFRRSCDTDSVRHGGTKSESVGKAGPSRPMSIVNCDRV